MADETSKPEDTNVQTELDENETAKDLLKSRKIKLGMLTRKMNVIKELMTVPSNVKQVMENVARYDDLLGEFKASHKEYQHVLSEKERESDDALWYEPKRKINESFMLEANAWLGEHEKRDDDDDDDDGEDISPEDSVSASHARKADNGGSKVSSTSSTLSRAAAEKAALEVRLAALKEKHAIESEEAELARKQAELAQGQEKLRKQKEMLAVQSELDAANAKLDMLSDRKSGVSQRDGMNEHFEKTLKLQGTKEFIGKEYDEPKVEKGHSKGMQDASVRLKSHALPPQPMQLHAIKEPYFLPSVRPPPLARYISVQILCPTKSMTTPATTPYLGAFTP